MSGATILPGVAVSYLECTVKDRMEVREPCPADLLSTGSARPLRRNRCTMSERTMTLTGRTGVVLRQAGDHWIILATVSDGKVLNEKVCTGERVLDESVGATFRARVLDF